MPVPAPVASSDYRAALTEARRLAAACSRPAASADVLVGMLRAGGAAARLLAERGVTAALLEPALPGLRCEAGFDIGAVDRSSRDVAGQLLSPRTSSIHLLIALLRRGGSASDLLRRAGQDPARLRAMAMRALTGPSRVAERATPRDGSPAAAALADPAAAEAPVARPAAPAERDAVSAAVGAPEWSTLEPPLLPVLQRDRELGRLLDLLKAPPGRIPCVLGDPGSGRSSLLAALAASIPERPIAPVGAPGGTSAGAWLQLIDRHAPQGVVVVLDGCGGLAAEGSDAPAQLLASAQAGRRWILAATPVDLRRFETIAPELVSRLEIVALSRPAPDALLEMVETALAEIARAAAVTFAPGSTRLLLRLSPRYPSDRAEPGRVLGIAELAAGRAARLGLREVSAGEVADVVADAAGVPAERLLRTDDECWRSLESRLAERVVGHEEARARIADVLRRSHAGFRGRRPLASLLLLGPTGVGKTETARAIAESLFDGDSALVRLDLSEYSEPHSVARLIGSPPGYVGHEEGGQLTEAVRRRPAAVVLLDEIEKAHRDVLLLLLQVLEDGRLTDGRGRTVDFSASVVVMTSNLGSELHFKPSSRRPPRSAVLSLARSRLPPELWNRIDETLCYTPLADAQLGRIVGYIAEESSRRLEAERGIRYTVDASVIRKVLASENDRTLGARPLRRAYERLVESRMAQEILAGRISEGAVVHVVGTSAGELAVTVRRQ